MVWKAHRNQLQQQLDVLHQEIATAHQEKEAVRLEIDQMKKMKKQLAWFDSNDE
jgi:uncharacterized protein (DUF3084 family)